MSHEKKDHVSRCGYGELTNFVSLKSKILSQLILKFHYKSILDWWSLIASDLTGLETKGLTDETWSRVGTQTSGFTPV